MQDIVNSIFVVFTLLQKKKKITFIDIQVFIAILVLQEFRAWRIIDSLSEDNYESVIGSPKMTNLQNTLCIIARRWLLYLFITPKKKITKIYYICV